MKRFAAALVVALVLPSIASATRLATYDPATGNLSLYGLLATDIGLDVQSTENNLIAANAQSNGAIFDSSLAPGTLSWLNFGGLTATGVFDTGNILPPGLSGGWTPPFGPQGVSVFIVPGLGPWVQVPFFPEPASLLLASLGLTCVAAQRRR